MTRTRDPEQLFSAALDGDRTALARLLSLVERGGDAARTVGRLAYPKGGNAYTVGLTGAPGAGKSTLTDRLIRELRGGGTEVAVLAVDPSSPFSGGAFLGDRVRMQDHATDAGVFIRSMATRGHLGGLSLATPQAIRVLDAVGFPVVLVETVGVGQMEVEIAGAADTTVVVVTPGSGDAMQANKAGLLEVADVFAVNKADRPGVGELERDLSAMLDMGAPGEHPGDAASPLGEWRPPIIRTTATNGEGVADLWDAVGKHRAFLEEGGQLEERRARRVNDELHQIIVHRLEQRAFESLGADALERLRHDLAERRIDPYAAAEQVLSTLE